MRLTFDNGKFPLVSDVWRTLPSRSIFTHIEIGTQYSFDVSTRESLHSAIWTQCFVDKHQRVAFNPFLHRYELSQRSHGLDKPTPPSPPPARPGVLYQQRTHNLRSWTYFRGPINTPPLSSGSPGVCQRLTNSHNQVSTARSCRQGGTYYGGPEVTLLSLHP